MSDESNQEKSSDSSCLCSEDENKPLYQNKLVWNEELE